MASETEREESNQEIEVPQSTVGGEEEKVVVEEQEEAADEEKIPAEEERVGEDEGDPSEDDEEEKSGVVKFEGGVVKGEEVVEGEKKKKKQSLKEKGAVPRTPTSERPSRERKTVERYTETVSARSSASKPVSVVKGRGTQLKDIPNVAFKLSKRKADDTLQMLHAILFGKKGKVQMLKRNISMFSGFAWDENEEEKQRAKVKEKLDKCVKEKLLDFVDILNIPVSRSAIKKEELSAKLLEFLEAPHVTTDSLLAEKEKSKKRKAKGSVGKSSGSSGAASRKSRKKKEKDSPAGEKHKQPSKSEVEEVDDKSEHSESADESMEDADNDVVTQMGIDEKQNDAQGKDEVEEEEEEPKKQLQSSKTAKKKVKRDSGDKDQEKSLPVRKEIQEKSSKSPAKSPKTSSISKSKTPASEADSAFKVSSANHGKLEKEKKKDPSNSKKEKVSRKKQTSDATKAFGKDQGKAKSSKPAKAEPTTAEMHEVVAQILREVDFNTATLSDILTQVGAHFGVDLSHRKSEVKGIITEVINNMSDEEEEDDNGNNNNDDNDNDDDDDDDKTRENQGNDEDDNDDSV